MPVVTDQGSVEGWMDVISWTAADEASLLDLLDGTPFVDGIQQDELQTGERGRTWLGARGYGGSASGLRTLRHARDAAKPRVRCS